jgi:hypothetical protein
MPRIPKGRTDLPHFKSEPLRFTLCVIQEVRYAWGDLIRGVATIAIVVFAMLLGSPAASRLWRLLGW